MADDDSWLYGEDNDEVEEPEAVTEEVEAVKGERILPLNRHIVYLYPQLQPCPSPMRMVSIMVSRRRGNPFSLISN